MPPRPVAAAFAGAVAFLLAAHGPAAQSGVPAARGAAAAGDVVAVNSVGMRMVLVPAGTFVMGTPAGAPMRQDEETQRRVTLTRAFRISSTEVTQQQWLALMPANRSPQQGPDLPATSMSWTEANEFCQKLSEKEKGTYRLPTEAEWEYACRAGGDGVPQAAAREAVAWFAANSDETIQPVGRKQPNAWGLFDMLGNVAEWTLDAYAPYPRVVEEEDPVGPSGGSPRVVRGGSWRSFPPALRCAARASAGSPYQLSHVGLRVVQETGADPADPASFRVMTFNIRYDNPADGEDAWPKRRTKVASMIRFHGADVIGTQEALRGQIADLEAALPELGWFGVGRSAERDGEHCAVFYRRDRFELLAQDTFWLSETPRVAGSRSWDAALPRIVTWGRLRDRRSGLVFVLFNTHLDHKGEVARRESARLLRREIEEIAGATAPVVVTGDFNTTSDSEPYRILTAPGRDREAGALTDAMRASACPHHGPTSSWNGFTAVEPGRRIDFVFVRPPVDVQQHGILADTFDGRFPSDHLPVLAEIALARPARPYGGYCPVSSAEGP